MPDWSCSRCGAINLEGQRLCEACGAEPQRCEKVPRPQAPRSGDGALSPPCSDEQNRAAAKIMLGVYRGEWSAQEGTRRLAELFQMPELEQER